MTLFGLHFGEIMRLRSEKKSDGRSIHSIRLGPSVIDLDDLDELMAIMEEAVGSSPPIWIEGVGELSKAQAERAFALPLNGMIWIGDPDKEISVVLGKSRAYVDVDQKLGDSQDVAISIGKVVERRRRYLPSLIWLGSWLYMLGLPALVGAAMSFWVWVEGRFAMVGIPDYVVICVVTLAVLAGETSYALRTFGGGVRINPSRRQR
jgi:hypothetical protein